MNYNLKEDDHNRLHDYMQKAEERAKHFIGYPIARDFDYSELYPLLSLPLNNVGDPLVDSTYDLNSRSLEQEVLAFFAELFNAPENNWWGYVTNGGSEGNLYGLYVARELFPNGIVYYSEATHYSVQKNIQLLNLRSIVIRTQENGEMDYEDLRQMLQMHRDQPVIMLANIGTTMTEAKDDLGEIQKILRDLAIKNHYIHCDAALAGTYSALLKMKPGFDFTYGADSIAISGHKFIGSPIPCGLVLVKKNYKERIGRSVPYIGTVDTTITGSRNGHSPIFLWYAIKKLGKEGLKHRALTCLALAGYAIDQLQAIGVKAWRNPDALTIVFPKPSIKLRNRWQIATENEWSHIICMPGITKYQIDEFVAELAADIEEQKSLALAQRELQEV
ncbi:histidine decarboxylase [Solitalea canadensis]|uniref:PLP-dependent enzyme, glutamate decarboxylase n=1 Tax=Solitalea canadensis (strain ATCC 29591 / DSM 3403 / JCM 21819 / LMG 8368 / NBRC 15130 / NCIMB 12057 / USAM 9D) TaxID=929556 RepID=H8KQX0_SOLCM|nr:histidine decarboxylase [Solitalea canadensis]AFD07116.1 PLP-dependent enzyme, glutamate decarboxylase [Solitalea canadensis DSM 3403]